jgi:transcriptional regulator with XRE-family HTH domain
MDFAEKLKAARLEAGLSQRQLCGDVITRNMLSQIENGSAKPSMATLGYLAQRLGKTISYFLEDQAVVSPNLEVMTQARSAYGQKDYAQTLAVLEAFKEPDDAFGEEAHLLTYLAQLGLARQALSEDKLPYAKKLLQQAGEIQGIYITEELERSRQVLLGMAGEIASLDEDDAILVLAKQAANPERVLELLQAVERKDTDQWNLLRAEALFSMQQYGEAATCYENAQQTQAVLSRLEACYRELGDYKRAYEYACKQK